MAKIDKPNLPAAARALAAMRPPAPFKAPSTEPWIIVRTEPRREYVGAAMLEREGFEVYVPQKKVLVMPPRNRLSQRQRQAYFSTGKLEMRPWLPGYCFIRGGLGHLSIRDLHTLTAVTGAIFFGDELARLSAAAVIEIRRREGANELDVYAGQSTFPYTVGEQVRMADGPWSGLPATVERVEENREIVHMLANLFGRQTRVELHVSQIEKL